MILRRRRKKKMKKEEEEFLARICYGFVVRDVLYVE
jgi:hypothetical protein